MALGAELGNDEIRESPSGFWVACEMSLAAHVLLRQRD